MRKLVLPLSRLNPVALVAFLSNVITKMTGNLNFPTPAIAMAVLQAALTKLQTLIANAHNGSTLDKVLRDDQVAVVNDLLQQQANYVEGIAKGDLAILESSGFPVAKLPTPLGIPNVPKNLDAMYTGKKGQIDLRFQGSHGANFYTVEMSLDGTPDGVWTTVVNTTRTHHSVTSLKSDTKYFFRVFAVGTAGTSAASDPAFCIAA